MEEELGFRYLRVDGLEEARVDLGECVEYGSELARARAQLGWLVLVAREQPALAERSVAGCGIMAWLRL